MTLRFANPLDFAPPQLVAFVEEVHRLSDGTIEFEFLPAYGNGPDGGAYSDAEATIVADLADSTIDIGWVGARALPGFDALLAPLLVDSHDLQQAVFEAGIPQRMLADFDDAGLAGIAVLPGPLRRLMGVEHPFAVPADFNRAVIANDRTPLAEATMAALGAHVDAGRIGTAARRPRRRARQFPSDRRQRLRHASRLGRRQSQLLAPPAGDRDERRLVRGADPGAAGRVADRRRQRRRLGDGGVP